MSQETIEQTFTVEGPTQLTVINIRGRIDIQPGDDGKISVSAVKHMNSGNADRTEIILTQDDDGHVTAETKFENTALNLFGMRKGSPTKVDYHITAPKATSVTVKGVANETVVAGLEGIHSINSVSGAVHAESMQGETELVTVSGHISAAGYAGHLTTRSVSGRTTVTESDLTALSAESVSGSLAAQLVSVGEGPYHFKTVSGNACLQFLDEPHGTVNAKTLSGQIRTPWGNSRSRGTFTAGSGTGPAIEFKSVSGGLKVYGPGGEEVVIKEIAAQEATAETALVAPTLSRQEILDKIANGEISVDEAIGVLSR